MRTIIAALAATLLMVIGASAAPATNPVRPIEDAATTALIAPDHSPTTAEGQSQTEPATAISSGNTIYQPPAPSQYRRSTTRTCVPTRPQTCS